MPSLANARKGGRVGAIRVLAADLLKVKPILMFRDGLVRDVGIVRGMDAGIDRVVEHYRTGARYGQEVFLFHAGNRRLPAERLHKDHIAARRCHLAGQPADWLVETLPAGHQLAGFSAHPYLPCDVG